MEAIFFSFRKCLFDIKLLNNSYIRNYARHIAGDKIVNLDQNTLTGRLMMYLKTHKTDFDVKTEQFDPKEACEYLRKGTFDLTKLTSNKIVQVIGCLEDTEVIKSNREYYRILNILDEGCCFRPGALKPLEILNILDAYMDLMPNRITTLKFYKIAMDDLFSIKEQLKGTDYLRYIFYIGLMKKCVKSQKMLRQTLAVLSNEDIKHLSAEELCVIANSTFKTSTKISNTYILEKIKNYLNDNLMLLKDPAIFVTLIKSLRHNRSCDEDLLATITYALFFNKAFECYTFQTYSHLLALFSDNLYYDDKLMEFLTKKCVEELKYESLSKNENGTTRGKQIVRFLWGMSNLNCTFLEKSDMKNVIVPKLIEKIEISELDIHSVIDTFLYLWMLNYKCYELVPYILENKEILDKVPLKNNSRQRLNELLTFIYHEDRPLFKQIDMKPQGKTNFVLSQHLKNRPCLQSVLRSLRTIGPKMDMKFEVGYQIPYMNILGITGYKKHIYKCVNIEVLDHFTTLKNTENRPSGLMQVKLRILDGSEEALVVVKENEVEEFTEAKMEQYLQDELDLVC